MAAVLSQWDPPRGAKERKLWFRNVAQDSGFYRDTWRLWARRRCDEENWQQGFTTLVNDTASEYGELLHEQGADKTSIMVRLVRVHVLVEHGLERRLEEGVFGEGYETLRRFSEPLDPALVAWARWEERLPVTCPQATWFLDYLWGGTTDVQELMNLVMGSDEQTGREAALSLLEFLVSRSAEAWTRHDDLWNEDDSDRPVHRMLRREVPQHVEDLKFALKEPVAPVIPVERRARLWLPRQPNPLQKVPLDLEEFLTAVAWSVWYGRGALFTYQQLVSRLKDVSTSTKKPVLALRAREWLMEKFRRPPEFWLRTEY
jgi:hypothetical protein